MSKQERADGRHHHHHLREGERATGVLESSGGLLELVVLHVVGVTSVLGSIKTGHLVLLGDTEDAKELEREEEERHHTTNPSSNGDDAADLVSEHLTVSTVEGTLGVLEVTKVRVGHAGLVGVSKETDGEDTPSTAESVHRGGSEGVVNLELLEELARSVEDDGTDGTNKGRGPGLEDGASSGDGHKSSEETVADSKEVPDTGHEVGEEEGSNTGTGSSERGGHGDVSSHGEVIGVSHGKGRSRVESVPSNPEDESTEDNEGSRVSGEGNGVTLSIETTDTGSNSDGTDKSGNTTSHVDDTRSSKVNDTKVLDGLGDNRTVVEGRHPAVDIPDPVGDDGVDETSEEERVEEVGKEGGTLGDGTGDNGGSSGSEGPLEEPNVESVVSKAVSEEVGASNETVGVVASTVGKSVTEGPVSEGTGASVEDILKENVHGVLGTNGTSAKHSETGLHEEHEESGNKHVGTSEGGTVELELTAVALLELLESGHTVLKVVEGLSVHYIFFVDNCLLNKRKELTQIRC